MENTEQLLPSKWQNWWFSCPVLCCYSLYTSLSFSTALSVLELSVKYVYVYS